GPHWQEEYIELVHRRMRSWGINTLANCSQPAIYLKRRTPYTATVYDLRCPPQDSPGNVGYVATIHTAGRVLAGTSGGWGKFPDVFDPSFRQTLRREISDHQGKAIGDPWCLGYFVGNELNWGRDETALARAVLVCPADQPAKQVFLEDLKAKYGVIEKLNAAWHTQYPSWEAVLASTQPLAPEQGQKEDFVAFLEKTADAYFRQCRDTLKEIDPEGLYLGCRFAGWSHRPVFQASAKYCDVVSVNRYAASVADLRLPDGLDKPVLVGEFHFGALDRGKFHATLCLVPDQKARAEAYEKYVRSALENPLIVGVHWHQYGDQATSGRDDGENFQNGFVDGCDTPYWETIEAARRVGYQLYEIRSRQPLGQPAKE
ncbi:MAG TPA: beta-galactosidase, partial [Thermoguttaceae bacterium]|nr:beta-galactosidase [Thermoguttaceae bacterium]